MHGELLSTLTVQISILVSSDQAYFVPFKAQRGRSDPKFFALFQSSLAAKKRDWWMYKTCIIFICIRFFLN